MLFYSLADVADFVIKSAFSACLTASALVFVNSLSALDQCGGDMPTSSKSPVPLLSQQHSCLAQCQRLLCLS